MPMATRSEESPPLSRASLRAPSEEEKSLSPVNVVSTSTTPEIVSPYRTNELITVKPTAAFLSTEDTPADPHATVGLPTSRGALDQQRGVNGNEALGPTSLPRFALPHTSNDTALGGSASFLGPYSREIVLSGTQSFLTSFQRNSGTLSHSSSFSSSSSSSSSRRFPFSTPTVVPPLHRRVEQAMEPSAAQLVGSNPSNGVAGTGGGSSSSANPLASSVGGVQGNSPVLTSANFPPTGVPSSHVANLMPPPSAMTMDGARATMGWMTTAASIAQQQQPYFAAAASLARGGGDHIPTGGMAHSSLTPPPGGVASSSTAPAGSGQGGNMTGVHPSVHPHGAHAGVQAAQAASQPPPSQQVGFVPATKLEMPTFANYGAPHHLTMGGMAAAANGGGGPNPSNEGMVGAHGMPSFLGNVMPMQSAAAAYGGYPASAFGPTAVGGPMGPHPGQAPTGPGMPGPGYPDAYQLQYMSAFMAQQQQQQQQQQRQAVAAAAAAGLYGLPGAPPGYLPMGLAPGVMAVNPAVGRPQARISSSSSSSSSPSSRSSSSSDASTSSSDDSDDSDHEDKPSRRRRAADTKKRAASSRAASSSRSNGSASASSKSNKRVRRSTGVMGEIETPPCRTRHLSNPRRTSVAAGGKERDAFDGERRLVMDFTNFGTTGKFRQSFGGKNVIIPDGLRGTYIALGQPWAIEIDHVVRNHDPKNPLVCISYAVINRHSGVKHALVETEQDALRRSQGGRTLGNKTFREAVEKRKAQLKLEISEERDPEKQISLLSQLKGIATQRISEGPLYFGLRHAVVQKCVRPWTPDMESNPSASGGGAPTTSSAV